MDTWMPTGFILVVLPAAWLAMQILGWWWLNHRRPRSHSSLPEALPVPAEMADTSTPRTLKGR